MPEGLATEDGTAIDLDAAEAQFAQAMNAPEPDEPEHPAPPKREQLSEEELGAKYGWTTDAQGNRRAKRAKGRPSTKARTTDAPLPGADKPRSGPKGKGPPVPPKPDLSGPLTELTSALWMVMAAAPIPADPLRVKVRAQAKVLRANQGGLVQGVNLMAANNGMIRRGVEALTMGSAGWVLPATMAVAPFCVQTAQLWRMDPEDLLGLAQQTEEEWAAEFQAMQDQMAGLQAEKEFFEREGAPAA
jgi:hypothetical protein